MSSFTLYIRRAELFHTEEYIKAAFYNNDYGLVSDVQFIKKSNEQGKAYNGVIVAFEYVFQSPKVAKLREELATTEDNTGFIIHDQAHRRYWIVQVYEQQVYEQQVYEQQVYEPQVYEPQVYEPQVYEQQVYEKQEKPEQANMNIELLVIQLNQMKRKMNQMESQMMDYEYDRVRNEIVNQELREQLLAKDEIIATQQCKLVCMAIDLTKKESECEELQHELNDQKYVIRYIEEQANEMREMLNISDECFDKGRMTVEELD